MAISTRKVNRIIADYKAGVWSNKSLLAKAHKISRSQLYKILQDVESSNADIVDMGVEYELAKKNTKNVHEKNAIEDAVAYRISTIEIDNKLMENNRKLALIAQKKLVDTKESIDITNVRSFTGAIRDIEAIAQSNKDKKENNVEINIQNNNTQEMSVGDKLKLIEGIRDEYINGR